MNKKIILATLLLSLFVFSLGSVQANVTTSYVSYCIDNLSENFAWDTTTQTTIRNKLKNISDEVKVDITYRINNYLEANNLQNLLNRNMCCFLQTTSSSTFNLKFILSNMTSPNGVANLGYLYIKKNSSSWFLCSTTDLNTSSSTDFIYLFDVAINSSSLLSNFTSYRIGGSSTFQTYNSFSNWGYSSNSDLSTLYVSSASAYGRLNPIYADYPINNGIKRQMNLLGVGDNYFLKDNTEEPVPEEPDNPDEPDNPGGGTTTSGVDLTTTNQKIDDVKNEITTQGQAITGAIESQTEKIEQGNQIAQETQDYLKEEATGEEQEQFIEDSINDIQDSLNDELSNSEIFRCFGVC